MAAWPVMATLARSLPGKAPKSIVVEPRVKPALPAGPWGPVSP